MDIYTTEQRSELMGKVRGKNTKPEVLVRRILHRLGYRFRLHRKDLPGKPDIVLPKYKKVIYVHGCFWHRHQGCKKTTTPANNQEFWLTKFEQNMLRDQRNLEAIREAGWEPLVIWQCETQHPDPLAQTLLDFLECESVDRSDTD